MDNFQHSTCVECPTRVVCIASRLPRERLEELPEWMQVSNAMADRTVLYQAGDPAHRQYHVRSGMFKTFVTNPQGNELITGFHLPGDIIGVNHCRGEYAESATALETSTVCELEPGTLEQSVTDGIYTALLDQMCARSTDALAHQMILSQPSAQARLAAFFLNYSEKLQQLGRCGLKLYTPMSRADLANYLGMTPESLSRSLARLSSSGVIATARSQIEIVSLQVLQKLAAVAVL